MTLNSLHTDLRKARFTIGLLACDVSEEISYSIWRGVSDAANRHGLNLIFFAGGALNDPIRFRGQSNILYGLVTHKRVDGLIVLTSSLNFSASRAEILDFIGQYSSFPIVTIEETFQGIPSVLKDDYHGLAEIASHLIEAHQRRKMIFMQGPAKAASSQIRLQAFIDTLDRYGLPFSTNSITPALSSWTYLEALDTFKTFLQDRKLRPGIDFDAIIAVNDENALAAMEVLQSRGVRIPDEVSLAGFDDLAAARAFAPPLTTVRHPGFTMGARAVDLLLSSLYGQDEKGPVVVPAQMIIRRSCGCMLPTISVAAGSERVEPVESQLAVAGLQPEALAQKIAKAIPRSDCAEQDAAWLVKGFSGEVHANFPGTFLNILEEILFRAAGRQERIQDWQDAISLLREWSLANLSGEGVRLAAEDLCQQARVMIADVTLRNQTHKTLVVRDHARRLRAFGALLAASRKQQELVETIARELPGFGVSRCCMALYEDRLHPLASARLVLAYGPGEPLFFSSEQGSFPSGWLAPDEIWNQVDHCSLLVEALYFRDEPLGFILFEVSQVEEGQAAELFDALQIQISSALKATLLQEEADAARQEAEVGWRLAEERRRAAEEANQLKSSFLSMVSHELRAPLNVIAGLSENMIQFKEASRARSPQSYFRDLERIRDSAQHLDGLIQDVLDLASSHVGQLKLVYEKLNIVEALKPAIEMGESLAFEKGLSWRVVIPERLPKILWDRTRLRQVVINLVSNAIKFTDRGEVVLEVSSSNDKVTISVQDTGVGIPLEDQAAIFEEFRQSHRTTVRGYGGLGLGLAICRRLVEMGGGQIGVESSGEMGGGARFHFSLPALEEPGVRDRQSARSQVVLLISRHIQGKNPLFDRLTGDGYDVEEMQVDQDENWLESIVASPPGAILLDFEPAPQQGWEMVDALKKNPVTHDIPVMFYSLFVEEDRGAIIEPDYLKKPMVGNQLEQALERYGLRTNDQGSQKILIADDEPDFLDLHTRLVKSLMPKVKIMLSRNGKEALDLMQREVPDLVLLDLMMPELDGFQVLEAMKEIEKVRSVPVIILTSHHLTEDEMQRINLGVSAVLSKGIFSAEETLAQVEAVLKKNKRLGSEAQRIARLAMAYIHSHFKEPISRKEIAAYVGVSPEYLSTCFHREVGVTPMTYLERYRIKQARHLLEKSDSSVTEIGLGVGFADGSYFTRVFHREVGVSPLAYRRGSHLT